MDLNAIKARLASLSTKTKKRNDIWKPKDKHVIRCLPYPSGEPFLELGFHYDVGNVRSVLCPKHNFNEDCAICDLADKLRSWKDESGEDKPEEVRKSDFELFKKLQVRERWYITVVDRSTLEEGPKFWSFGKTIFEQLLRLCAEEERAEVAGHAPGTDVLVDVDSAFDLEVDFKQPNNKDGKGNDKPFPISAVTAKIKPTKLTKTKKETTDLLDKIPDIYEVYQKVSSDETEKILNDFLSSGAGEEAKDTGVEYKSNSAEKPVEGGLSIDDAFEQLAE